MVKQKEKKEEGDWYTKGQKGFERKHQLDTAASIRRERGITRFWLKPEEEANIVFVDDIGFFIHSHQLKIGERWDNYFTCMKDHKPCSICEHGHTSTYISYFTVIDTRQFVRDSDGTVIKNRKVLYPAKGSAIKKIEDMKKKRGSLIGLAFKVKRYTKDDPNCGLDFEFIKKVDIVKNFGGEGVVPIDYLKVLAPPTIEELESIGMISNSVGSDTDLGKSQESGKKTKGELDDLL